MSKAALKKELKNMSHEQLEQIIIDAYDARAETKEYFEFFLNPDVKKRIDHDIALIDKELRRSKWGNAKFRITVIRKIIKGFASLNPGSEAVIDLMFMVLQRLGAIETFLRFTSAQEQYAISLFKDIFALADSAGLSSQTIERVDNFLRSEENGRLYFRKMLAESMRLS